MFDTQKRDVYLSALTDKLPELTVDFLGELQSSHISQYSFNSIAVLLGEEIMLDTDTLFEKIVNQGRGGYCFEHNKLFYELLVSLGFNCELVLAQVLNNKNVDPPRTHRITKVTLENVEYVLDVGFGPKCPLKPLLLRDTEPQKIGKSTYRIRPIGRSRFELDVLDLSVHEESEWYTIYRFDESVYTDADCMLGNYYSYTHPKAVFKNNLVVSQKDDDEVRVILNGEFSRITQTGADITPITSKEQLNELLINEYGLTLEVGDLEEIFAGYCKEKQ
jgi:N-hydroxyarylamine O-acetyltransferase